MAQDQRDSLEPTESYRKQKRALIFFAGALLTALFIGIEPTEGQYTFLPFKLKSPDYITHILACILFYNLLEHLLNWRIQIDSIRSNSFIARNFRLTNAIAVLTLGVYASTEIIGPNIGILERVIVALHLSDYVTANGVMNVLLGAFGAIAGSIISNISSNEASRHAKEKNESEQVILNALNQPGWVLQYNPSSLHGKKKIAFQVDGTIGLGRNHNESTWRLRDGFLEILNDNGEVHSRFRYVKDKHLFRHTNDADTPSLKGQRIYLDASFQERYGPTT